MKKYGSTDIQKLAKVTKTQVIHWTQTGVVVPYEDAKGRGARRVYDWQNLIEIMICRELNKYTMGTHVMELILMHLRDYRIKTDLGDILFWDLLKHDPKTDHRFIVYYAIQDASGEGLPVAITVRRSEELQSVMIKDFPSAHIIDVRALITELGGQ